MAKKIVLPSPENGKKDERKERKPSFRVDKDAEANVQLIQALVSLILEFNLFMLRRLKEIWAEDKLRNPKDKPEPEPGALSKNPKETPSENETQRSSSTPDSPTTAEKPVDADDGKTPPMSPATPTAGAKTAAIEDENDSSARLLDSAADRKNNPDASREPLSKEEKTKGVNLP